MTEHEIDEKTIDSILDKPDVLFDEIKEDRDLTDKIINMLHKPVSRRNFIKFVGAGVGSLFFGKKLFGNSVEDEIIPAYNNARDIFTGNLDRSWLTLAYVINGIKVNGSYDFFYKNLNKINKFLQENQSKVRGSKTRAMLSVAYAMSGFDDDVVNIHREATSMSRGNISGAWLTRASVLNRSKTLQELYSCLDYSEGNKTTAIVSLAYSASGLDSSVKDLYFKARNMTVGDINGSWVTLAYVAGEALHDEKKQENLIKFFKINKRQGDVTSSMLTLAYAINNYEDVMPQYHKYKNKARGDINGALLTIAYAVAKNPNNKIFPRFR